MDNYVAQIKRGAKGRLVINVRKDWDLAFNQSVIIVPVSTLTDILKKKEVTK